jgi:Ser-tRNA(Ala) deacylase AlaX
MAETEQKGAASSRDRLRSAEVASALHVLKGAMVKVLNTPMTITTKYDAKDKGRLVVEYTAAEPPSKEKLQEIEDLANAKIREDLPIEITKMSREEAESKYKSAPVNNTYLYDKFGVPAHVTELNVLEIKDWNVNCVTGEYLKSTGALKGLKVLRVNHRPQKSEFEICFQIGVEVAAPTPAKGTATKSAAVAPNPVTPTAASARPALNVLDDTLQVTRQLASMCVSAVREDVQLELSAAQEQQLLHAFTLRAEQLLALYKNQAYARGFKAHDK